MDICTHLAKHSLASTSAYVPGRLPPSSRPPMPQCSAHPPSNSPTWSIILSQSRRLRCQCHHCTGHNTPCYLVVSLFADRISRAPRQPDSCHDFPSMQAQSKNSDLFCIFLSKSANSPLPTPPYLNPATTQPAMGKQTPPWALLHGQAYCLPRVACSQHVI